MTIANSFVNILTSPTIQNVATTPKLSVAAETGLKAIGRPAFTLLDKNADEKKRKYSATSEFLYQIISLGLYLGLIAPVLTPSIFNGIQKVVTKNSDCPKFHNLKDFQAYNKLSDLPKNEIKQNKLYSNLSESSKNLLKNSKNVDTAKIKGAEKLASITSAVLGLAVIAPIISHALIHPIMDVLDIKKPKRKKHNKHFNA